MNRGCDAGAAGRGAARGLPVALLMALLVPPAAGAGPGGGPFPQPEGLAGGGPEPGPLRLSDGFLLAPYLPFEAVPSEPLPAGRWRLRLELSTANTFIRSGSVQVGLEIREGRQPVDRAFFKQVEEIAVPGERLFLVDGETRRGALRARRGLGQGFELEVTLPWAQLGGGRLDSAVEGFHDLTGLDQDGRQSVLHDGFLIFLQSAGGETFLERPPGSGLADAVVSVRRHWRAADRPHWRWGAAGSLKLPTGDRDRLLGTGSVDGELQLDVSRCRGRTCYHGAVGVARLGSWDLLGLPAQWRLAALAGFERRLGALSALNLQMTFGESPLGGLGVSDLAADVYQLSAGWKRWLGGGRELFVAVTENVIHFENGADLALHLGIEQGL